MHDSRESNRYQQRQRYGQNQQGRDERTQTSSPVEEIKQKYFTDS